MTDKPEVSAEPTECMVDLKTLGTTPGSPILTIGACAFGFQDYTPLRDMFYVAVDLESCLEMGMRVNADILRWWMQQSEEARAKAFFDTEQVSLPLALDAFTDWLCSRPTNMWGNSASFDLGLLSAAYRICGKVQPWEYTKERCYRTVKNLPYAKAIKLVRIGDHHNALDDALSQAYHLRDIYNTLGY